MFAKIVGAAPHEPRFRKQSVAAAEVVFAETNPVVAAATYTELVFCGTGLEGAAPYGVDAELKQGVFAGRELDEVTIVRSNVKLKQDVLEGTACVVTFGTGHDVVFSMLKLVGAAAYGGGVAPIVVLFTGTDIVGALEHGAEPSRKQSPRKTEEVLAFRPAFVVVFSKTELLGAEAY